jgi:hypothetical protein
METKKYECDAELEDILKQVGFHDCTKKFDRDRGKRTFRKGKLSAMAIHFDYENFKMFENDRGCDAFDNNRISQSDLQFLIWYIQSPLDDREHISDGHYDLRRVKDSYTTMKSLLGFHQEFNHITDESQRFERLLKSYEAAGAIVI